MSIQALVTVLYGLSMAGGGWAGYRAAGSLPSLIAGGAIGGLALVGGLLMLFGNEAGRAPALFAAAVATLFFGWKLSRAIVERKPAGRALGILAFSVVEVLVLTVVGR